jgi:23S rRNA (cytosine1962-C5)-methyltransferase
VTGAAPDHPVGLDALEGAYLKAVWLLMGERHPSFAVGDRDVESDEAEEGTRTTGETLPDDGSGRVG